MNHDLKEDISQFASILQSAFNTVQDIFYIMEVRNDEFYYYFANQVGRGHLDYEKEMEGKTFYEVLPKEKADFLIRQYRKCVRQKKIVVYSDEIVVGNQRIINESVLTPFTFKDKMFIATVVRDVTEYNRKITELNHIKNSLEINEERLNSLVHNDGDAIITVDSEGYILESNNACKKIIGYDQLEIVGLNISKFFRNNDFDTLNNHFKLALENQSTQFNSYVFHKNGSSLYVNLKFIPITMNGIIRGAYVIAKDITYEKKDYENLQKSDSQLKSFLNHNADPIYITDLEGKIEFVNDSFIKTFGFNREELIQQFNPTIPDWLKDETSGLYEKTIKGNSITDLHVIRQKKNGELLELSVTFSPLYDSTDEISGIASIARDITNFKKRNLALYQENQDLNLIWKHSTDAILLFNQNAEIVKINPTFTNLFLYKKEEINSLSELYLDHQKNQILELLRILDEENPCIQFETKRKRKDGSVIDVLATYRKVENGKTFAIATYKDITKEKHILQELAISEEKYRKVLDASPEPLLIHNGEIITYLNKAALNLAKAKNLCVMKGRPIADFIHSSNKEEVLNRIKLSIRRDFISEPVIERFITLDGESIYAETSTAAFQEHGQDYAIVMLRDVTQKLRAEKSLKESEERFRIIAENTNSVIKIIAPTGKVTYCSPSIEDVLGIPIWDEIGKSVTSNIHYEDLELFEITMEESLKTKKSTALEMRCIHRDGYAVWIKTHITPILNENEEVERIMLISNDITDLKQKETTLTQMAFYDYLTNLPNRRLFYKQLEQAMLTTDKTGKISALMIVDCDKFKLINDTLGHDIGDEVIKEFANRLKLSLRHKDTISRIGGDEFTVVTPEMKSIDEVISVTERLLKKMNEPIYIFGHEIQLTASIGIAIYNSNSYTIEELFKKADQNLYRSKESGGNIYTLD
ncbi:PAS domain S-box protein [Ureibacillus acetophenoni]|uniref:PAS domain S-box-containing protein/diguanylate cyclase (GGDEF)-like protein n=1 Tax=Ureibacillus acetophenoni TaxID=614649 RepID=A0A285U5W5_9BACL|nr:PAS domain S-box protein [Ureibacillus acetophenoni]SOC37334.1 PAS domain S-box-containing protein/diguanylate cyclase (GGDEF)-like protein [Ureibacillus acetophenoni]